MKKHIIIELCEINRREGATWIDIIASCPRDYVISQCNVYIEYFNGTVWETLPSLIYKINPTDEAYLNLEVSPEVSKYALYTVELIALTTSSELDDAEDADGKITETAYISDVEFMYDCMLQELFDKQDSCNPVSDDLISKYLMLYGHQLAQRYNETYQLSSYLYKKMLTCGSICNAKQTATSCGCK